eukprot:5512961-Amphidinium_carterae.1
MNKLRSVPIWQTVWNGGRDDVIRTAKLFLMTLPDEDLWICVDLLCTLEQCRWIHEVRCRAWVCQDNRLQVKHSRSPLSALLTS